MHPFFLLLTVLFTSILSANTKYPVIRSYYHNKEIDKALASINEIRSKGKIDHELKYYQSKIRILKLRSNFFIKEGYEDLSRLNLAGARQKLVQAKGLYPRNPKIKAFLKDLNRLKGVNPTAFLKQKERKEYASLIKEALRKEKTGEKTESLKLYESALKIFAGDKAISKKIYELNYEINQEKKKEKQLLLDKTYQQKVQVKDYIAAAGIIQELLIMVPNSKIYKAEKIKISTLIAERRIQKERDRMGSEHYNRGTKAKKKKEYKLAIEQYQQGLAVAPGFKKWSQLIEDIQQKSKQERERKFNQAIDKIEALFQSGISYSATEKYQEAIAAFGQVIKLSQKYNQIKVRDQAKELQRQSVESFNAVQASEVNEQSPYFDLVASLSQLGSAAYKNKDYKLARNYYSDILELFPKNSEANLYYISASIELRPETKKSVIIRLQNEVAKNMNNKHEANRLLKLLEALGKYDTQTKKLRKEYRRKYTITISKAEKRELTKIFTSAKRTSMSNPQESLKKLNQVIEVDPQFPGARALMARIEGRLSRTKWDKPLKVTNQEAQNHYANGMLYYNAGEILKALESFSKAVKADPAFQKAKSAMKKCKVYLQET